MQDCVSTLTKTDSCVCGGLKYPFPLETGRRARKQTFALVKLAGKLEPPVSTYSKETCDFLAWDISARGNFLIATIEMTHSTFRITWGRRAFLFWTQKLSGTYMRTLSILAVGVWMVLAEQPSARGDTFIYDDAGRLTSVTQSNGLNQSYSPDPEGNILSASQTSTFTGTGSAGHGIPDWWKNFFFDTTVVDPFGNPSGDGMSNLMKFALGRDPSVNDASSALLVTYQAYTDGKTYPFLAYIRSKDASESLTFLVEQSTDLHAWLDDSPSFEQLGDAQDLGDGTEEISLRCTTPVADSSRLFFRLKVTTP